jgi:hypothetical protein
MEGLHGSLLVKFLLSSLQPHPWFENLIGNLYLLRKISFRILRQVLEFPLDLRSTLMYEVVVWDYLAFIPFRIPRGIFLKTFPWPLHKGWRTLSWPLLNFPQFVELTGQFTSFLHPFKEHLHKCGSPFSCVPSN